MFKEKFQDRHNGPNSQDIQEMLQFIKADSLEHLISETIPEKIRFKKPMDIPPALTEHEMLVYLKGIAAKNQVNKSYIGLGYYDCITPKVILRNILENPGWYTQYTPYQAEIAQGRLEALLNFQTLVSDLTGLEIANASLLDEGTAAAEAMGMFFNKKKRSQGNCFFVSDKIFPQTLSILQTRAKPLGIELILGDLKDFDFSEKYFGVLFQYPDGNGEIQDGYRAEPRYAELSQKARENNIRIAVAADLMSLVLLTPPGEWGADVVIGSSQRFGVPMGYGGPHAAFLATKDEFKRNIPGRIIGISIDAQGNPALRMALQTREQHIRRDKATSNICTAQVLLAIMASMYAVYHGKKGLTQIAKRIHLSASALNMALQNLGYEQSNNSFFDTLQIQADENQKSKIKNLAEAKNINLNYFQEGKIGISLDETTFENELKDLVEIFAQAKEKSSSEANLELNLENIESAIPENLQRKSDFLTHEVFNNYHSETEMLRYIKKLESRDLSLGFSMIALGSCTMKLNATTEMIPVTWSEFGGIHPFAPRKQAQGYTQIFEELEADLKAITGFSGISLQPNAGAQGEYTGLMVIRKYFEDRGEKHRNIALIPASAHGTNPASAVMAGMKVVVTKCDEQGNIDLNDLKEKAELHSENLAALMVTYPSTHGVFEEEIMEICEIIHKNGGQVYMDGANMNAQVGLTSPANIGADVCHLNLHKTFCIPHGGGGPGMGPIGVAKHLVPYLPSHPLVKIGDEKAMSAVSAAPWGSASILLISYVYIRMMGTEGLTDATKIAILNANYIKEKLAKHYEILYTGKNGRAAHEMIVDTRSFKRSCGIEVEDIAKRLIDYGFHAPTISFPVAGTMMIEPTESESKAELDRFCEALISIREEIQQIELALMDEKDNVLKNAPHTAQMLLKEEWEHPYSREKAAYPLAWIRENKFWASVARVNNTHGDRNLICTCLPIEAFA